MLYLLIPTVQAVVDYTNIFDQKINKNNLTIVKFFAPWCGHCRAFKPKFEEVSVLLKNFDIVCAEVDCTVNNKLCDAQGVLGYPTINIYKSGKLVEKYEGSRETEQMFEWIEEKYFA
ncbi:Protein_disulfide isomerase PDI3 [Hexamita inflata]|uniref:Protein disulfide isomerase PDI3 n=1 Tax=Hexamita inflata TaxID=28002 RepID=A0AA86UMG6_9EUKA|nr:Protein disulfide isomerase PDI3 [Hexamita inflata]